MFGKKSFMGLIVASVVLGLVGFAAAEVEVKPEGKVYAHYEYNVSGYPDWYDAYPENDYNGFELTRAYFGAKIKLSENWSGRILSDIGREDSLSLEMDEDTGEYSLHKSKESGKYGLYLKYGYLDYKAFDFLAMRLGLQGTPFTGGADDAWRYRFVAKSLTDKNKMDSSADLGFSLHGKFPNHFGGYQLGVFNGEGYKSPEVNEGKQVHLRVNLSPIQMVDALKKLSFAFSILYEKEDPNIEETYMHYNALLHYFYQINDEMSINFGVQYAGAQYTPCRDAESEEVVGTMGYSIFAEFGFLKNFAVFGRYDFFDPDTENDEDLGLGYQDEETYIVAGFSFKPISKVKIALDYQSTMYTAEVLDDEGEETTKPSDSFIFLHTEFAF